MFLLPKGEGWDVGHGNRIKLLNENKKGYTLIELVIVLALLMTVGIFIASTLFLALRGAKKAQTIDVVKQNGNYAMTQVAQAIRNSQSFIGASTDGSTYASCAPVSPNTPDFSTSYTSVRVQDFFGNPVTLSCNAGNITIDETVNDAKETLNLLDTSKASIAKDTATGNYLCSFNCAQTSSDAQPIIRLKMTLSTNSQLLENQDTQFYETTVFMRNNVPTPIGP